jgi:hypothetical protein
VEAKICGQILSGCAPFSLLTPTKILDSVSGERLVLTYISIPILAKICG